MSFKRKATAVESAPSADELTACMVGIGMNFAAEPRVDAEIEATLLHASESGMLGGDLRALSVLTTWLRVHQAHVNADRLVRLVATHPIERVRAYWGAVGKWLARDRRFARLVACHDGDPIDVLPVGTAFQIARRGEDERFAASPLRVPLGTLRDRDGDVVGPEVLARRHAGYRNRVLMGPTWRADVWTTLEHAPELSVSDLARRASCSFATAWQVARDFRLLRSPPPNVDATELSAAAALVHSN